MLYDHFYCLTNSTSHFNSNSALFNHKLFQFPSELYIMEKVKRKNAPIRLNRSINKSIIVFNNCFSTSITRTRWIDYLHWQQIPTFYNKANVFNRSKLYMDVHKTANKKVQILYTLICNAKNSLSVQQNCKKIRFFSMRKRKTFTTATEISLKIVYYNYQTNRQQLLANFTVSLDCL